MEDEPIIKPRRLGGTPAYKYRNRLGWYCVGGMFSMHLIMWYFMNDRVERKIAVGWYDESKYMKERKLRVRSFMPQTVNTNLALHQHDMSLDETRDHLALSTLDGDL